MTIETAFYGFQIFVGVVAVFFVIALIADFLLGLKNK